MLNSIWGSLCIYGTTEVLLSSNTSTSSENNYYFEKHLWCLSLGLSLTRSFTWVSVLIACPNNPGRNVWITSHWLLWTDAGREHMSLACVQTFPLFLLLHREKGQFKNTRRRLHAGCYFPSNLFTLHFYFLQEAIAYFPLMILVSGILMSGGIKRLNRFFSNRVCIRQGQSTTASSGIL